MPSRALPAAAAAILAAALCTAAPPATAEPVPSCSSGAVTTYTPPPGTNRPFGIVVQGGATWFAHGATIDTLRDGTITEHPVPDPDLADVGWLTAGPEGSVWFADRGTGRLGTIDTAGTVHEFQIPDGANGTAVPQAIVLQPDNVWFTDQANNRIGARNRTTGAFTFHTVPTGDPLGLIRARDGGLYFTERAVDKVGRLDPATGLFTEWTLTPGAFPNRLATDPEGNVWFTELHTAMLGRIDNRGRLHETPLPTGPVGIRYADGRLYTAMPTAGQLDIISRNGHIERSYTLPAAAGVLQLAVALPYVWVADGFADHIYRVAARCPP